MPTQKKPFENIAGKGENAGDQHFLLFKQCFLSSQSKIRLFDPQRHCCLQILSIWTKSNILSSGKGLTLYKTTKFFTSPNRKHLQTTK